MMDNVRSESNTHEEVQRSHHKKGAVTSDLPSSHVYQCRKEIHHNEINI